MIMSSVMRGDSSGSPVSPKISPPDAPATTNLSPRPQSLNTCVRTVFHQPSAKIFAAHTINGLTKIKSTSRSVSPNISGSFMVGSSRKRLVVGTPKHTRLEPAAQHPWRPDPADTRIPIGPPDTSVHEPLLGRIERVQKIVVHKIGFQFQASKDAAKEVIGYVLAARHLLADRFGLPEQGFGFGRLHARIVGPSRVSIHS